MNDIFKYGSINIKGARENNLKNINLSIPRSKLVVMTGVSGSGKTSLAFDTIYAEGQRRYVESLSAYARQFLDNLDKPDVDSIDGLSPAIAIDQKTTSKNPRSTVGTVTEIYDYLRLLYARIGHPTCPTHGIEIESQTYEQMVDRIFLQPENTKVVILSPLAENRKGTFDKALDILRKDGFTKVMIDNQMFDLDEEITLEKNKKHDIFVVIDRFKVNQDNLSRCYESIETACRLGEGKTYVEFTNEDITSKVMYSEHFCCPTCNFTVGKLEPALFSFNAPLGACPECKGLGSIFQVDIDLLVPDKNLSIADGAIRFFQSTTFTDNIDWQQFKILLDHYKIDVFKPFKDLADSEVEIVLNGSKEQINYEIQSSGGNVFRRTRVIEGVATLIYRRYQETTSGFSREYYASYLSDAICPKCLGSRLSETVLAVLVGRLNIYQLTQLPISECYSFINDLKLTAKEEKIANLVLKEIKARLNFLMNVGLEYLTLNRKAGTLSGGEAQRIRLATQIGSKLTGVLYVLDEPSIGLHQRDNHRLINALKEMRDLGNTLIVVEHDEEIMHECDYLIDIGPGAGIHGGEVIAYGAPSEFYNFNTLTADYLSGRRTIPMPAERRSNDAGVFKFIGCTENNLKNIDVEFPLSKLTVVTGVSGSGKSTLVNGILGKTLSKKLNRAKVEVGKYERVEGLDIINRVIDIDQSPIGRTPRSNPATYTGVFDHIRDLFAETKEAKMRGYNKSRFSFNLKGGRCETCSGDGVIRISMHFLPDVYVPCESCRGKRYNRETLEVKYKDKNISEVLDMTIEQAEAFFANIPQIFQRMTILNEIGLGYLKLGQSATTLSGGEAQRVKLASELHKRIGKDCLLILDEPTTGLHTSDIEKLMRIINRMVDTSATIIVIEHNLDVIKSADYIIDLGPEGGDKGGYVIATGTPEEVALVEESYTGQFLRKILNK